MEQGGSRLRGGRRFLSGTGCTTDSAPFTISRVEENVDENVVGVVCPVVRNFSGHGFARFFGRRRRVGT